MGRKWANIVAKKTAKDGATSNVYAKFGVEIYAFLYFICMERN